MTRTLGSWKGLGNGLRMGGEATSAWSSGRQTTKVKTNNTVPCCHVLF